jgi:hypothetical protein
MLETENIFLDIDIVAFGVSFVILFRIVTILVNSIGIIDFKYVKIPKKFSEYF